MNNPHNEMGCVLPRIAMDVCLRTNPKSDDGRRLLVGYPSITP